MTGLKDTMGDATVLRVQRPGPPSSLQDTRYKIKRQHSAHKRTTEATMDDPCYDRAKGSVESTMALWGERVWNAKAKAGPRASVLKLCLDARAC